MKLAVLTDIHANLQAFQAVLRAVDVWAPDQVLVAGDVVNRGPRPSECLDLVHQRVEQAGWRLVRGNHEDYVLDPPDFPSSGGSGSVELHRFAMWTREQLDARLPRLLEMPFQQSVYAPDGSELRVVHASMRGNRHGIYPETSNHELAGLIAPAPAVLVAGHTHRPLIRSLDGTLVVNAGSSGLPFDGDIRPTYAQITWSQTDGWQAKILRVSYDLKAAEQDFYTTGYLSGAGPLAILALMELRQAVSLIYGWVVRYQNEVDTMRLDASASIRAYLSSLGLGLPIIQ